MKIGNLEIHRVSDGIVHVDAGGPFGLVPRPLYSDGYPPDDSNTIPMALTCLLVKTGGASLLIDTGLGDRLDAEAKARWRLERPEGGLVDALARLDVAPDGIDIVINTHLHADHCGGNTRVDGGQLTATFPRATYMVQRMEWADASHPDARTRSTYASDNFEPLLREGRLQLLHGDKTVVPGVDVVVTPGHTRAHQSVVLGDKGWWGFYPADLASYAAHLARLSWMTAYDAEPLETLRTKQRWQGWLSERAAWVFFEHDAGLPVGRLVRNRNRFDIESVEWPG
jgi:glyoxylase-like metal-dependent hydrolase (beta-lactamase superfamily II)